MFPRCSQQVLFIVFFTSNLSTVNIFTSNSLQTRFVSVAFFLKFSKSNPQNVGKVAASSTKSVIRHW